MYIEHFNVHINNTYIHVMTLETLTGFQCGPRGLPENLIFGFDSIARSSASGTASGGRDYGDQDLPIDRSADRRLERGFDIRFSFFVCTLYSVPRNSSVYNFLRSTRDTKMRKRREEATATAAASEGRM